MKNPVCFASLCALILLGATAPQAISQDTIAQAAEESGFRGSVLIRCGDEVVYESSFGARAPGGDEPIDNTTLYYSGSVAKTMTSAVVLQLESEGKLALDTTLAELFPDAPEDKRPITIRQLLSHTSGFVANHGDPLAVLTRDGFVAWALAKPLANPPGEEWSYSNVGYSLLAAIAETLDGGDFRASVRRRIFEPAQMEDARFVDDLALDASRLAIGEGPMAEEFGFSGDVSALPKTWLRMGPGGIVCTARDLLAFDRALRAGAVLTRAQQELAATPVAGRYGLGWRLLTTAQGSPVVYHDGGFPGFNAEFFRFPKEDIAFVTLSAVENAAFKLRGVVAQRASECAQPEDGDE